VAALAGAPRLTFFDSLGTGQRVIEVRQSDPRQPLADVPLDVRQCLFLGRGD
jgi:hypothetical protein